MKKISSNQEYYKEEFKDLDLSNKEISQSRFYTCTFINCRFQEATFTQCFFEECKFEGSNLSMCKLTYTKFLDCKVLKSKFMGIDWTILDHELGFRLVAEGSDFSFGSFAGLDITECSFEKCKLRKVDFENSNARRISFNESDLSEARFKHTNIEKTDFREAYNYIMDPRENRIKGAKFSRAEVSNLLIPFLIEIED